MKQIIKELEIKDLPKLDEKIKDITLAFDINTNETGYCFLINGRPVQLGTKEYISIGAIKMVEQVIYQGQKTFKDKTPIYKTKQKEFTNYGDRLFWGSGKKIQALGSIVGDLFRQVNPYFKNESKENKPKINIIFEIAEIPNKRFGGYNQSITTTRKLALYVGAVTQQIFSQIDLNAYFVSTEQNTEVKFIKPQEWQFRMWSPTDTGTTSKEKSIKFANRHLISWGLEPTTNDNIADAINIAIIAKEVRDNLFVTSYNINKKELLTRVLPKDIYTISSKILTLEKKAHENKVRHLNKIRQAKNSKYNYEIEQNKKPLSFLSKTDYERFLKWSNSIKVKKEQLKNLKGKVYERNM